MRMFRVLQLIFLSDRLELLLLISFSLSIVETALSLRTCDTGTADVFMWLTWVLATGSVVLSNRDWTESIMFWAAFAAAAVTSLEKAAGGSARLATAQGLCANLDLCCKQNTLLHSGQWKGRKSWQEHPMCVHFIPSMFKLLLLYVLLCSYENVIADFRCFLRNLSEPSSR